MNKLHWVVGTTPAPYHYAYADASQTHLVGWVAARRMAYWSRDEFGRQFDSLTAAKEYIENRYILWIASGEGID